jgi:hypothetical protein
MTAKVTPIKWGNWNHIEIIQKIPEQHTRKARNKGAIENSQIGHCTHNWECANVGVQNVMHGK